MVDRARTPARATARPLAARSRATHRVKRPGRKGRVREAAHETPQTRPGSSPLSRTAPTGNVRPMIGTARRRRDGEAKVRGATRYVGDMPVHGLLHARPVLAAEAH